MTTKTLITTIFALIAFAANSILCRLALTGSNAIDPFSFTIIRLLAGSTILIMLIWVFNKKSANISSKISKKTNMGGNWLSAFMLFLYAICFSYAYVSLDTGTGALILFGAVQITMVLMSVIKGNKLHYTEWLGMGIAFWGFVYLILPNISAPSLIGFIVMALSGIGWGVYSVRGRGSK
ncbi:MAG: EamA family transporter, partial [Rhizobiales bacterium]|nr:EamA family transporter [Hyphomicrobiales bacterium]